MTDTPAPEAKAKTKTTEEVIALVEKLMRLAGKNPNEAEAASATAKAMALLADHNLDLGVVDGSLDSSGKRADEKLLGGFYEWERDIWQRVADLNFCWYWNQHTRAWKTRKAELEWEAARSLAKAEHPDMPDDRINNLWSVRRIALDGKKLVRQHRLVGRVVNIAATKAMVGYLTQAMERLTRERLEQRVDPHAKVSLGKSVNSQLLSRWAVSFREGMAENIASRLWDRRQDQINEEQAKKRDAERQAAEAGMAGATTATGLTLFTLRKSEEDANRDFLYGEGYSANMYAERAAAAQRQKEAEEAYTAWAAANPEEAAREQAKAEKAQRSRSTRSYRSAPEKERDWGAFRAGNEAADKIGLDVQAEGGSRAKGLLS